MYVYLMTDVLSGKAIYNAVWKEPLLTTLWKQNVNSNDAPCTVLFLYGSCNLKTVPVPWLEVNTSVTSTVIKNLYYIMPGYKGHMAINKSSWESLRGNWVDQID